jgi:hypothetical protein
MAREQLVILKSGNTLFVGGPGGLTPLPGHVFEKLHLELSYQHRDFEYVRGKRRVTVTTKYLSGRDDRGRLQTHFGFLRRIDRTLREFGHPVAYYDMDVEYEKTHSHPRPRRYEIDVAAVAKHFSFRPKQLEGLKAIASNFCGTFHAVTGFGKMAVIVMVCLMYPYAKIHIVTRRIPLVNKLVEYLTRYISNVGQFGDGRKVAGKRITVYSADSLGHSDFDCDLLLGDEGHELGAPVVSAQLARYQNSRNFMFSATVRGRSDGSDAVLQALFGDVIFSLPYWEGVALGLVVPIQVRWRDAVLSHNPTAGARTDVDRRRRGVWFNEERNDIISADVGLFVPQDEQFQVLADTIYHAVELYKRIKAQNRQRQMLLVYDKMDLGRLERYKQEELLADLPKMTPDLKEQYRKMFESGAADAISTGTWSVGIDPVYLSHFFMASPSWSEILTVQGPGRTSRIETASGKSVGYIYDYRDQFDDSWFRAAQDRFRIYRSLRWEQTVERNGVFCPVDR